MRELPATALTWLRPQRPSPTIAALIICEDVPSSKAVMPGSSRRPRSFGTAVPHYRGRRDKSGDDSACANRSLQAGLFDRRGLSRHSARRRAKEGSMSGSVGIVGLGLMGSVLAG